MTTISGFTLTATQAVLLGVLAAPVQEQSMRLPEPPGDQAVLWVLQRGTDVVLQREAPGEDELFDSPNGAWGLELAAADGGDRWTLRFQGDSEKPAAEWRWLGPDDLRPALRAAVEQYLNAGAARRAGDHQLAATLWMQAAAYAAEANDAELALQAGLLVAVALYSDGRNQEAVQLLRELVASSAGNPLHPSLLYELGSAQLHLGENAKAQENFDRSLREAEATGDAYSFVMASLRSCYAIHRDSVTDAIACYKELDRDPKTARYPKLRATLLNAYAAALEDSGQLEEASALFARVLELRRQLSDERGLAVSRYNLANAQKQAGSYVLALANYLQAFIHFRSTGRTGLVQISAVAIADLYRRLGDPELSESWYRHALSADWSEEMTRAQIFARMGLAQLQIEQGQAGLADAVLEQVKLPAETPDLALHLTLARARVAFEQGRLSQLDLDQACAGTVELGHSMLSAQCAYWRGQQRLQAGHQAEAAQLADEGLRAQPPADVQLALRLLHAEATLAAGDIAAARDALSAAIAALDNLAAGVPSWQTFNFAHLYNSVWDLVLEAVLSDASIAPQDRAATLWRLDEQRRRITVRAFHRHVADLDSDDKLQLAELQGWSEDLLEGGSIPIDASERLLRIDTAGNGHEPYPLSSGDPPVPTVSYWLGRSRSVALVGDGAARQIELLPARNKIDRSVRSTLAALASPAGAGGDPEMLLAKAIWQPVSAHIPPEGPLNLALDGLLSTVPFEALPDADGELLVHRYQITYGYGLAAGAEEWQGSREVPVEVFAAPAYAGARPALVHSQGEAQLAEEIFDTVQAHLGEAASRKALLAEARRPAGGILHIAAHARSDALQPARSGLWMAEPNGFVSVRELASLRRPGRLMVLSACSTNVAVQSQVTGPVQSLALAALTAGFDHVVATTWDVADVAAYHFAEHFYAALADGATVRDAGHQAKLQMLGSLSWRAPVHWAPFQVWRR